MKKILYTISLLLLSALGLQAQYFQANVSVVNPGSPTAKLSFKIKPSADIANFTFDGIEMFIRVSSTETLTFGTISTNTVDFPGLSITAGGNGTEFINGWAVEDGYTNYNFVSPLSGATTAPITYLKDQEYEVFNVDITGPTTCPTTTIQLAADFVTYPYYLNLSRNTAGVGGTVDFTALGANGSAGISPFYGGVLTSTESAYFQTADCLLPVKFLSFLAIKNGNDAKLNWTVELDNSNKYFDIERSFDGQHFTALTKVNAFGNGKSVNTYETKDAAINKLDTKVVYYRIKQVDKNGAVTYSAVRNLNISKVGSAVSVFPNPVRTTAKLIVDAPTAGTATITIRDASGKQVKMITTQFISGINQQELNLSGVASGEYNITVVGANINQTIKLSKTN